METRGRRIECPRYEDLEEWEGKDFVKEVRAHGGLLRVAKELGLRTKMSMRNADWQDFESFRGTGDTPLQEQQAGRTMNCTCQPRHNSRIMKVVLDSCTL